LATPVLIICGESIFAIVATPTIEILTGNLSAFNVPDAIFDALILVILAPEPTKNPPVIIPVALILPPELIPTPASPSSGLPPTWKVDDGLVVATPTFPAEYILVNPNPGSTSTHCEVGMLTRFDPSP
jgi:hypothetical protein